MATKAGIERLKLDEGFRSAVYRDTMDIPTIGYGYNLKANPQQLPLEKVKELYLKGISKEFAEQLLLAEVNDIENELHLKLDFWSKLNATRRDVLVNMAYNLGVEGLLAFTHTLRLVGLGLFTEAAAAMVDSLWARQVKGRATRLATLMKEGAY